MSNVSAYFNLPAAPAAPAAPALPALPQAYGQPQYGAYNAPAAPAMPAAPAAPGYSATPYYPGQQPVAQSDTWVPTSNADPYVAGMRTSASGMVAFAGASRAAINARFSSMLSARAVASKASISAANRAGRSIGRMQKMTKGMAAAKTSAAKSAFTDGVNVGVGGAFRHTFLSLSNVAKAIGSSAIVAIPMALITNYLDFSAGKITKEQRNALFVADSVGYTATGATATLVGGALGSTFLGPIVGTVVGVGAGFALGWVYEKYIRPRWGKWVHDSMYAQPVAPTPVPVDPYAPK